MSSPYTRRHAVKLFAATGIGAVGVLGAAHRASAAPAPGIVKPLPPELFTVRGTNAETRFEALRGTGFHTPLDRFFVRNHTATPRLDARTWRLRIRGSGVAAPRAFTLAELKALPAVERSAFLECAGNGRSFFDSQQGQAVTGTAWRLGAIGSARWRGARLSDVLRLAGVRPEAVDVQPTGLDAAFVSDGENLGHVRRPLPIGKAMDDVLLAYEMNGEPLPYDHGYPVRVLVPGWVGVASVKWVGDIEVADRPLASPWNTDFYRLFGPAYPSPEGSAPLTRQTLKSAFELPEGAELRAGRTHHLTGRAWSGRGRVTAVHVRTETGGGGGGRGWGASSWARARLHDDPRTADWVRWSLPWRPRHPGPAALLARTTDSDGTRQPVGTVFNEQGYLFDAIVRHGVRVV
ncbi:sulfite oxidase [Streptomyces sp. NPDC048172]|uniref:sulfite oxidase n=1 Tax=Streptomyces sp. NPDC048172 TaxID=3365505 RepID=UPI003711F5EC